MFVAGVLGGRGLDPDPDAGRRAYAGVSELITTLLLNFVGTLLAYYVADRPVARSRRARARNHRAGSSRRPGDLGHGALGGCRWRVLLTIVVAGPAELHALGL